MPRSRSNLSSAQTPPSANTSGKVDTATMVGSAPSSRLRSARGQQMQSSGYTKSSSGGIKTQTVLPSADTAAMMFWALLASG
jgi:hypothetical protein